MYILKLNSGYLVGKEYKGTPCKKCVSFWLTDRHIYNAPIETEVKLVSKAIELLNTIDKPGLLIEVYEDGVNTQLECRLDKHPECKCKGKTVEFENAGKLNYAFSVIRSIETSRYGTPSGNLWMATATHLNGLTKEVVGTEREQTRRAVVDSVLIELSGKESKLGLLTKEVVAKYSERCKQPMLIVGSNNWTRTHLPFFILQAFDVHLMFYPNAQAAWVVGAVAISRTNSKAMPIWNHASSQTIETALKQTLHGLLVQCSKETQPEHNEKLNAWFSHWIYRSPKISLRDILQLETYEAAQLDSYKPKKNVAIRPVMRLVVGGKNELKKAS